MNTPLITWYAWCPVKQIYPAVIRGLEFGDWVQTITYTCGDEPPHYQVPAVRLCSWCNAPPPSNHLGWNKFCTWGGCPYA